MNVEALFKSLNEYYWSTVQPPANRKGIWKNTVTSLLHFVRHYAFERRGGVQYAVIAAEAVENNRHLLEKSTIWDTRLQKSVNGEFGKLCKDFDVRQNATHNIFEPGDNCLLAAFSPEAIQRKTLAQYIHELIQKKRVREAFDHLLTVRGIGEKIAAFYLRDISLVKDSTVDGECGMYLQPIDIWTARAADLLPEETGSSTNRRPVSLRKKRANKLIAFECKNELRTGEANIAFWVLGAQIAQKQDRFERAVREIERGGNCTDLLRLFEDNLKIAEGRTTLLKSLIKFSS
jgi:hypothetical protein